MTDVRKTLFEKMQNARIPTYEANVPVSGPLPHAWGDWPTKMQDTMLAAMAELPREPGERNVIVMTRCEHDPDGFYVKIVVMTLMETRQ